MSTLREHIEAIRNYVEIEVPFYEKHSIWNHAVAALAILDFKPLDSDLPETGESYPPTTT